MLRAAPFSPRIASPPRTAPLYGPHVPPHQANAEKVLRLLPSADGSLSESIYRVGGPLMTGAFSENKTGDRLYWADLEATGE